MAFAGATAAARAEGARGAGVTAAGTASRRGVVLMLVLDQSSSMNTSADPVTGLTACQAMVQAAQNFIIRGTPYAQGTILKNLMQQGVATVGEPTQGHAVARMAVTACACSGEGAVPPPMARATIPTSPALPP